LYLSYIKATYKAALKSVKLFRATTYLGLLWAAQNNSN